MEIPKIIGNAGLVVTEAVLVLVELVVLQLVCCKTTRKLVKSKSMHLIKIAGT